ncbi:MAG TPA: ankyrin repeat domain-containing protein [Gammaproteobacteria bacterium]|nr:ankyrin repeat domain-containing protein [Gammaproteobacteria bacterium]
MRCARFKQSLSGLPVSLTLLPNGVTITETENENIGSASLFNAIIKHQTNMIRSLLRVGIDLNTRNIEGTTPLMAAAEYGVEDITRILLENGASTTALNNDNESAYDIAVKNKHFDIAKLISPDEKITPSPG